MDTQYVIIYLWKTHIFYVNFWNVYTMFVDKIGILWYNASTVLKELSEPLKFNNACYPDKRHIGKANYNIITI